MIFPFKNSSAVQGVIHFLAMGLTIFEVSWNLEICSIAIGPLIHYNNTKGAQCASITYNCKLSSAVELIGIAHIK